MFGAILQICASLRSWQLTCSYFEAPRLLPRFVAVSLLDFSVWKEGTILDTNSASGSTFLIVSAGSDERTQAWLGSTSQSGLPPSHMFWHVSGFAHIPSGGGRTLTWSLWHIVNTHRRLTRGRCCWRSTGYACLSPWRRWVSTFNSALF